MFKIILINGYVLNTKNTTIAATNPTTGYSKTASILKKQINFTFKSNQPKITISPAGATKYIKDTSTPNTKDIKIIPLNIVISKTRIIFRIPFGKKQI